MVAITWEACISEIHVLWPVFQNSTSAYLFLFLFYYLN